MIDQALDAFAVTVGILAACLLVAALATATTWTWRIARHTRPGWWIHRHLPIHKRP